MFFFCTIIINNVFNNQISYTIYRTKQRNKQGIEQFLPDQRKDDVMKWPGTFRDIYLNIRVFFLKTTKSILTTSGYKPKANNQVNNVLFFK